MPSFTVTATGQQVALDQTGQGEAAFTVTNTTPQSFGGRLVARPQEPAKPEWFTIVGEPLRQFTPNATEQVVVKVQAPPGTPPATYSFRLDAISEVHPDEDFTEGPSVSFTVGEQQKKKGFPIWIPIVIVLVLLGAGALIYILTRGDDEPKKGATGPTGPTAVTGPTGPAAPATPAMAEPDNGKNFPIANNTLPDVTVKWNVVSPTATYRVEVETCDPQCDLRSNVIETATTRDPLHSIRFTRDVDGQVRVIAIDNGVESAPSEWRRFGFVPAEVDDRRCDNPYNICWVDVSGAVQVQENVIPESLRDDMIQAIEDQMVVRPSE